MYCRRCGREIPDDANLCPYCGEVIKGAEPPKPETPPPTPQPYTAAKKRGSRTSSFVLIAVIGVAIIACISCSICGETTGPLPDHQTTATARAPVGATTDVSPTHTPLPTSTPIPTATPVSITYRDIERNYEDMTDIQWDNYSSGIIGMRVHWRGRVIDIDEDGTIYLDVGQELFHRCFLDGVSREVAATINKGTYIEFEATVTDITTFLGLTVWLDDPVLISTSGK